MVSGHGRVRPLAKVLPLRKGAVWGTVRITFNAKAFTTSPDVACIDCGKAFCGGVTRIKQHITKFCTCSTEELKDLKKTILLQKEEADQITAKKRKISEVDSAAGDELSMEAVEPATSTQGSKSSSRVHAGSPPALQPTVTSMLNGITSEIMDNKVADLVFGEGLPFSFVESPQFLDLIVAAKCAPKSYKPPNKHRLAGVSIECVIYIVGVTRDECVYPCYDCTGEILEKSVKRLKADENHLRSASVVNGCTVVSDGWDDASHHHLINFLVATNHGAFFDGTVKISSDDKENAENVARLISDEIERVGPLNVIQVVTDTCSVMKSAWLIVEKRFPWITCSGCAPHVLSLLLKDIGSIPEVAGVLTKVKKVLNRFWGRKRWCRNKLREVVRKNHGKDLGLYRAAVTRFAGKVREMGRMYRLKADLKYIVDLPEYMAQDFSKRKSGEHEDDDDDPDGEGGVKQIILDEEHFWKPLLATLKLMLPIYKILRMCDSDKPVVGKIYDKMFMMVQSVQKQSVPWAKKAAKFVENRWEYLHSYMHGAGYAFDPEFFEHRHDWDLAVKNGVSELIERICLRDVIQNSPDPVKARSELTTESEEVVALVAQCERELADFREGLGPFTKKKVIINAKLLAPAAWWNQYCSHLPQLTRVATSVLAQVVCSSSAERNWSIYGRIKHKGRTQLGHSKADKLVYCHEAIHLKNKLQTASYKVAIEKWDSDSDSDASEENDEEDLKM